MVRRLASVMAILSFAACLLIGLHADNGFATTVGRALLAMGGTFVVGLIVGAMAQKMLEENLRQEREKLEKSAAKTPADDR